MPTPTKPFSVLVSEGKSHRTKKELAIRKQGEEKLTSGKAFRASDEVKKNPDAYKEYKRINAILKSINKNDALYEAVVNRYCLMQAECKELEDRKQFMADLVKELRAGFLDVKKRMEECDPDQAARNMIEYTKEIAKITGNIMSIDKIIQQKRKMLLDIEKENVMTIASSLRSIPKKEEKVENPLLKALADD